MNHAFLLVGGMSQTCYFSRWDEPGFSIGPWDEPGFYIGWWDFFSALIVNDFLYDLKAEIRTSFEKTFF